LDLKKKWYLFNNFDKYELKLIFYPKLILFVVNLVLLIKCTNCEYDYNEVLHASLLFYEAQRSGKLPDDNRIKWRRDSMLEDKGNDGEDLTGGYFDGLIFHISNFRF
jgi:hypothetical protein